MSVRRDSCGIPVCPHGVSLNSGSCQACSAAIEARKIYAQTRFLNLPRAPLYVPGEKPPKGKSTPLGPIAKRVEALAKKFPDRSTFEAQRIEFDALLAAREQVA